MYAALLCANITAIAIILNRLSNAQSHSIENVFLMIPMLLFAREKLIFELLSNGSKKNQVLGKRILYYIEWKSYLIIIIQF